MGVKHQNGLSCWLLSQCTQGGSYAISVQARKNLSDQRLLVLDSSASRQPGPSVG